jgi:hypothetical protein
MDKEDPTNYEYELKKLRTDYIQMAEAAAVEIEQLRKINGDAAPRAQAFDAIQVILGLAVPRNQTYSEDVAWKLRKRADELRGQEKPNAEI